MSLSLSLSRVDTVKADVRALMTSLRPALHAIVITPPPIRGCGPEIEGLNQVLQEASNLMVDLHAQSK